MYRAKSTRVNSTAPVNLFRHSHEVVLAAVQPSGVLMDKQGLSLFPREFWLPSSSEACALLQVQLQMHCH